MFSRRYKLTLPIFYRDHGDFKYLNKEFLKVWGEVPNVLSNITFETEIGLATLNIDWEDNYISKIKGKLINFYTIEDYFNGIVPEEYIREIGEHEHIELSCQINIENYELDLMNERGKRILFYYIENIFMQIFLAMNLSTPGSFSAFSYELKSKGDLDIYSFSSSDFESAWIDSIKEGWPLIERIELNKTWNWIKGLNLGYRQIAENCIERALFSILTICKGTSINPNQLIWNAIALEALYGTPKSQITRLLVDRVSRFLGLPENGRGCFKKKIRDFYDLRSRFVHGELDLTHPLGNNVLDPRIFDNDGFVLKNAGFGFCIVIATLQKMIKNHWKTLKLKEKNK
ncbi:MAG: HEPN domain-containing protein [Bacillota bacterium]|nr:HEPN domain-containing protein [Bacillota bacterium]